jgi:hypothetical protein
VCLSLYLFLANKGNDVNKLDSSVEWQSDLYEDKTNYFI